MSLIQKDEDFKKKILKKRTKVVDNSKLDCIYVNFDTVIR